MTPMSMSGGGRGEMRSSSGGKCIDNDCGGFSDGGSIDCGGGRFSDDDDDDDGGGCGSKVMVNVLAIAKVLVKASVLG